MMDNSLEFWFRKLTPDSPPIGRIICLAERDDVYHVEVRMRGQWFSATTDYGVRFTIDPGYTADGAPDPEHWDVVAVQELMTDEVFAWCQKQVGKWYDWYGAMLSPIIPADEIRVNPYEWFCSELAAEVAESVGIPELNLAPDPSTLRMQLRNHAAYTLDFFCLSTHLVAGLVFGDADSAYLQSLVDSRTIDPDTAQKVMARIAG